MTPEAIRLCAELSQAAYLSPGDIRAWLQEKGFEEPHFLDASANPRGFLATRDGDATYVSFRGTERNFRDIFADVDACLVPAGGNGFLAHKGFWDSLGELYGVLKRLCSNRIPSPLILTGHSLGAALATLAAYRLWGESIPASGVVTFGSPRCVNDRLAAWLDFTLGDKLQRHVHLMDIVPCAPLPILYQHAGLEINLGGHVYEDWEVLMQINNPEVFEDHRIASYIRALEAA